MDGQAADDVQWRLVKLAACCTVVFGVALSASTPLCFELGIELTYPRPEASISGLLVFIVSFTQTILLFVPFDNLGTAWILYAWPACLAAGLVALLPFPVLFRRSAKDQAEASAALLNCRAHIFGREIADASQTRINMINR